MLEIGRVLAADGVSAVVVRADRDTATIELHIDRRSGNFEDPVTLTTGGADDLQDLLVTALAEAER